MKIQAIHSLIHQMGSAQILITKFQGIFKIFCVIKVFLYFQTKEEILQRTGLRKVTRREYKTNAQRYSIGKTEE